MLSKEDRKRFRDAVLLEFKEGLWVKHLWQIYYSLDIVGCEKMRKDGSIEQLALMTYRLRRLRNNLKSSSLITLN